MFYCFLPTVVTVKCDIIHKMVKEDIAREALNRLLMTLSE